MKPKPVVISIAVFLVAFLTGPAFSGDHPGKGHGKDKSTGDKIREVLPPSEPVFTEAERVVITRWSEGPHHEGLPPGLAKKDRLPPGLEKQLYKRGTLPPGLQKRCQPLPVVVERQMRVLPTGYRRVVVGGNVIIMNEKTALIYDVVRIAIP